MIDPYSLFKFFNYSSVKRKCSNAGKVSSANLENMKEVFLADVTAEVVMNEIPDELIKPGAHRSKAGTCLVS